MLKTTVYPKVEATLNKLAKKLSDQGFSPNQLTLAGLVLNLLAGCIYAAGAFFIAGIVLIAAGAADLLDGPLARTSKRVSKFGAFLDSTVDRYSDFFLFGGLALFFARTGDAQSLLLSLGVILGAFITSYTKARAENFLHACQVGIITRSERVIILLLGSLIPILFPVALWVLFLGTNFTALQRILYVKKALDKPILPPQEEENKD